MTADVQFMQRALELARRAEQEGEVPVGAVLVHGEEIIGEGWNRPISGCDPTAHAEIQALRAAGQQLGNYRLVDTTLYVTLEPCIMCIGAIMHARVQRLVYATTDPRAGAIHSAYTIPADGKLNHIIEVESGVMADECSSLLTDFFRARRK
jgi:tRNA(adenine34) deaminase